jgi:hypothetical protein
VSERLTVPGGDPSSSRPSGFSWAAAVADRERPRVSIVLKLILSTALLLAVVLVSCVSLWIQSETRSMRRLKRQEARAFAVAMSGVGQRAHRRELEPDPHHAQRGSSSAARTSSTCS